MEILSEGSSATTGKESIRHEEERDQGPAINSHVNDNNDDAEIDKTLKDDSNVVELEDGEFDIIPSTTATQTVIETKVTASNENGSISISQELEEGEEDEKVEKSEKIQETQETEFEGEEGEIGEEGEVEESGDEVKSKGSNTGNNMGFRRFQSSRSGRESPPYQRNRRDSWNSNGSMVDTSHSAPYYNNRNHQHHNRNGNDHYNSTNGGARNRPHGSSNYHPRQESFVQDSYHSNSNSSGSGIRHHRDDHHFDRSRDNYPRRSSSDGREDNRRDDNHQYRRNSLRRDYGPSSGNYEGIRDRYSGQWNSNSLPPPLPRSSSSSVTSKNYNDVWGNNTATKDDGWGDVVNSTWNTQVVEKEPLATPSGTSKKEEENLKTTTSEWGDLNAQDQSSWSQGPNTKDQTEEVSTKKEDPEVWKIDQNNSSWNDTFTSSTSNIKNNSGSSFHQSRNELNEQHRRSSRDHGHDSGFRGGQNRESSRYGSLPPPPPPRRNPSSFSVNINQKSSDNFKNDMSVDGWNSSNGNRSLSQSPTHGATSMSIVSSQRNDSANPSIQTSPFTGTLTNQSTSPVTGSDDLEDFEVSLFPLRDKNWLAKKVKLPSRLADYQINAKVGEGTFGEVFSARDKKTGETVAIKKIIIHNEKEGFPMTSLREIATLQRLQYDHIVPLLNVIVEPPKSYHELGDIYMVFPFMEHDLAGLLDTPTIQFSLPQIKCYMYQLLKGIFHLHKAKIMHRDLKAANILINNKGQLRIADFGLARRLDESRRQFTRGVVTRWYRPPELLLGCKKYSEKVDMWGVGCILAEMFTKKPILQGSSDINQIEITAKLCGTPTEENMPGVTTMSDFQKIKLESHPRRVRETFQFIEEHALDLIDKLLVLDPEKRLGALDALEHDFFFRDPLPAEPQDLPSYPSVHEYARRKLKQIEHMKKKQNLQHLHQHQHQHQPINNNRPNSQLSLVGSHYSNISGGGGDQGISAGNRSNHLHVPASMIAPSQMHQHHPNSHPPIQVSGGAVGSVGSVGGGTNLPPPPPPRPSGSIYHNRGPPTTVAANSNSGYYNSRRAPHQSQSESVIVDASKRSDGYYGRSQHQHQHQLHNVPRESSHGYHRYPPQRQRQKVVQEPLNYGSREDVVGKRRREPTNSAAASINPNDPNDSDQNDTKRSKQL